MRKIRTIAIASSVAFTALVLAGCGSSALPAPSTSSSSATSTQSSSAISTQSSSSVVTSDTSSTGAVTQTDKYHLVTTDGYQANVTVDWHADAVIDASELPVGTPCGDLRQTYYASEGKDYVFHGVIATVSADFPVVNGFVWPNSERISVDLNGGGTGWGGPANDADATAGITCFTTQEPNSISLESNIMNPESPTLTAIWFVASEKTPKNPTGQSTEVPNPWFDISAQGTCAKAGGKPDNSCTSKPSAR